MTFSESGPVPAQGNIAQQIFWYTAFTADMAKPGLPVVNDDGSPKWRVAPSPHGSYWHEGQKLGYQDVGSWTLMKSTPTDRAKAAWLYAQFVTSKTVDVKKSQTGHPFIRQSSIMDKTFTERAPKLGGLVEFYRSPARVQWTPTGTNVPDYPKLAQLWWQNIGDACLRCQDPAGSHGRALQGSGRYSAASGTRQGAGRVRPKLNEPKDAAYWEKYAKEHGSLAPQPKLANEKEKPVTVNYDELVKSWQK